MSGLGRQTSSLVDRLAGLYGLETGYRDSRGTWREVAPHTVMAVLRALGADLEPAALEGEGRGPHTETRRERALAAAVEARERELGGRLLEPVLLAWDGRPPSLTICLRGPLARKAGAGPRSPPGQVDSATGGREFHRRRPRPCSVRRRRRRNGADPEASGAQNYLIPPSTWAGRLCAARGGDRAHPAAGGECPGPAGKALPLGYHRLTVEVAGRVGDALVIAAPRRCFSFARTGPWRLPWRAAGVGYLRPRLRPSQRARLGGRGPGRTGEPGPAGAQGRRFVRGHVASPGRVSRRSLRTGTLSAREPPLLERVLPGSRTHPGIRVLRKSAGSLGFVLLPGTTSRP